MENTKGHTSNRLQLAQALASSGLISSSEPQHFSSGAKIFVEGAAAAGCYLIQYGQVELSVDCNERRVVLEMVGPGELIGLSAAFAEQTYSLTASASTPSAVTYIPHSVIRQCIEKRPALRAMILASLSSSVQTLFRSSAGFRSMSRKTRQRRS